MNTSNLLLARAAALAAAMCLVSTGALAQSSTTTPKDSGSSSASMSSSATSTTSSSTLKWSDKRFVTKTAEGSQLEIAMAQLAAQRATNPDVRNFAQKLVTDHEKLSQDLQQLAERKGVQDNIAEYSPSTAGGGDHTGAMMPTGSSPSSATGSTGTTASGYNTTPAASPSSSSSSAMTSSTATGKTTANTDWNDPTTNRHYRKLAGKQGADFDKEFISLMVSDHEDDIGTFEKKAKNADDSDVRAFAENCLPTLRDHLATAQKLSATIGS